MSPSKRRGPLLALLGTALLSTSNLVGAQQLPLGLISAHPSETASPFAAYEDVAVWRLGWKGLDRDSRKALLHAAEAIPGADIWRASSDTLDVAGRAGDIAGLETLVTLLNDPSVTLDVLIPSLAPVLDAASSSPSTSSSLLDAHKRPWWDLSDLSTPFHDAYHSLSDLYAFGDALVDWFPGTVQAFDVGETWEGRKIQGWKAHMAREEGPEASAGTQRREKGRKGRKRPDGTRPGHGLEEETVLEFVVQSGQHAREWVGPSAAMYFLHSLLVAAKNDPEGEAAQLMRVFTFVVVPTINPDGYEYSRDHSRLWRKNRQYTGSDLCQGIDLNSNWGYKWRPSRSAGVCSDNYPGSDSFEAFETRSMAHYLQNGTAWTRDMISEPIPTEKKEKAAGRRVRAFVDLHSYGQLFMFPFAHSCDDFPYDAEMLMEAGLGVAKAMRTRDGQEYQAGQACDMTYRAPGDAIDFTYGVVDARWSYSAELRDTGTYGFLLPPKLIRPTAEETAAGLLYLAKFIYTAEINP